MKVQLLSLHFDFSSSILVVPVGLEWVCPTGAEGHDNSKNRVAKLSHALLLLGNVIESGCIGEVDFNPIMIRGYKAASKDWPTGVIPGTV